jgi:tetratricopeptide (TPR) repeat protein
VGRIRKNVISWAIAVGLSAWGSAGGAQAEELTKADQQALAQIATAAEAGDCDLVLKRAVPFVERRKRVLPNELTVIFYEAIAACHIEAKREDEAYGAALGGTALAESTPRLWYVRLYSEIEKKRWTDVAVTLEAMTQGHSATLNGLPIPVMWELLNAMKEGAAAEPRTRVLKLLASDSYAPDETFGSNDGFRLMYAQDRIAAADRAAAGPVIARLEDPSHIATASLDPRMRGYLASTDLAASATKRLARHQLWVAREPDRLRPLIAAATNLRQLGRAKEALDLLRSAEPRLDKLTETEDSDQVNWWWNELALTYEALHLPDEAVEAYRNGSKASEDGVPNVSQLINLALAQLRFGRPKDALATIALRDLSAEGASPYGSMLYRRARACALHLEGRGGEAKADVDYVVSHEKDAPVAVTELHLCLEDMDAAAASAIRRLEDLEQRPVMLLELSDFDLAPPPLVTDRNARNREALKKREDVKAAIARAGGTRHFNVAEA